MKKTMEITIDDAISNIEIIQTQLEITQQPRSISLDVAISTMRKYKKIEEIVNGWGRYRKGVSSSEGDSVYMQKVSEVVEDGND
jgi:hypothetical protein